MKLIANNRNIIDYEKKAEVDLLKIYLSKKRLKEIREKFIELRYKFSKSKINTIRGNIYNIKNPNNLFIQKLKEIGNNLLELEKNLFKPKKYYNYHDTDFKGIRV